MKFLSSKVYQKIEGILPWFVLCSGFIVSLDDTIIQLKVIWSSALLSFSIFFTYFYLNIKHNPSLSMSYSIGIDPKLLNILSLIILTSISTVMTAKLLPMVLHKVSNTVDSEFIIEARGKGQENFKRSWICWGRIYLKNYRFFMNDTFCGMNIDDWDRIQTGDKIRLIGKSSPFGFSYEYYQVMTGFVGEDQDIKKIASKRGLHKMELLF